MYEKSFHLLRNSIPKHRGTRRKRDANASFFPIAVYAWRWKLSRGELKCRRERRAEMKTKRWIKFPEQRERERERGAFRDGRLESSGVASKRGYSRWAGCFR